MKCAICAADNPAGARYCVQCGAEHSLPTPIAAVAAAVSAAARARSAVPQAANAAQAEPVRDDRPQMSARRQAAPWARDDEALQPMAHGETRPATAAAEPAYARAPGRKGVAAFLIALALAIAALAFTGWRMSRDAGTDAGTRSDQSVMSAFPPEATPQKPQRPASGTITQSPTAAAPTQSAREPVRDPLGTAGGAPSAGAAAGAASPPAAAESAAAPPPVEIKPLPAKPAPRTTRRASSEKARPPSAAPPPSVPELAPPPPARAPEIAAAPKAAPAPPVVDRWTRMSEELSRCTREDFIARVICDQRVRFRYCSGYWGKVTQCPGNPTNDHGQ